MNIRHLLVAVPLISVSFLLQSALWVPTYDHPNAGGTRRLTTYIEAGIGDAKILNPILSADGASSNVEQLVFEGLIDVDENQNWVGDLAQGWDTLEDAYLAVLPGRHLPGGEPARAETVARRAREALDGGRLAGLADAVRGVSVLPAEERRRTLAITETGADGRPVQREVAVRVAVPPRVAFHLSRVVQDLFERLEPVLGAELLDEGGVESRIHTDDPKDLEALAPRMAELLSVREHNPVLVFHLRHGVRWHDGQPFTAADVKFTYDAIMDPRNLSPRTSSFEPVKAVVVVDDHTVRVVYKRLYSPAIIAWSIGIIPEHLLSQRALEREMDRRGIRGEARKSFGLRNSESVRHPVGTGPFRFAEWQPDEYIHLQRNEDYWKPPAEYSDVYFRVIPEYVTQEVEFRSGAIDYYAALPHQVARYRDDPRYQSISSITAAYTYIGYNLRNPLFQDVRVRRALGMAIDVDELIRYVLYGEAERVSGPFYKNTPFYDPETPPLPYDPEGAKRLLAEAGWTPGPDGILQKDGKRLEFKLITNNGNLQRKAVMTIAQNAWRRIGIDVRTQAFEWTVFLEDFVNSLQFDAVVLGWSGGALDPDKYQLWHSSQTGPYQLNFVGYRNPEADDLILRIRREYDPEVQRRLCHRLHRIIAADQPYTFLYAPRTTRVLDRKIVIVDRDPQAPGGERYRKIYATKSGEITYWFERWRKLPHEPVFGPEG
jgi:peptide/nickel transport system substrate-binding protein